jgi:hypothetical protein
MFRDPKNAFAIRVYDVITSNPKLANRFDILSKLQLNNNINDTMFNLELIDRDIDNIKANIYTKNLTDLADPVVLKTLAKDLSLSDQDITYISDLFSRLPLFAYMQSGINKTSANLVPYVSTTPFLNIMDGAVEDFTKLLADPGKAFRLLEDFYNKFNAQNSYYNKEKNRFKNYFTDIDFNKVGTGGVAQPAAVKIDFQEEPTTGYIERTKKNASADATIDFGLNQKGEAWTKKAVDNNKKKYIGINTNNLTVTPEIVNEIVNALNSVNAKTLNIAGMGIYNMKQYTQDQVDKFTYDLLNQIINSPNLNTKIESIRSGGQTGFDEAGAKASMKLGLPTIVLAPKGWIFRDTNGKDISNEQQFKARFTTTQPQAETQNLTTTNDPNIFIFDDSKTKTAAYYRELTSSNSTVGFVYNASKHELDKNLTIGSQSFLKFVSPDTALPFITSFGTNAADRSDNFSNLAPENYQSIKNYFDRKIQELKDAKDLGSKIALPIEGIGNANKMPQELFVYLSKRLFEELGYLNPGSTMYKDITEILNNKQGISDDEILASLGFESDPFNCV